MFDCSYHNSQWHRPIFWRARRRSTWMNTSTTQTPVWGLDFTLPYSLFLSHSSITGSPQAVSHPSTVLILCCLTSVIAREPVNPKCHRRCTWKSCPDILSLGCYSPYQQRQQRQQQLRFRNRFSILLSMFYGKNGHYFTLIIRRIIHKGTFVVWERKKKIQSRTWYEIKRDIKKSWRIINTT